MPKIIQPIKRHGGKRYLADWIISLMPERAKNANAPAASDPGWLHYVEPYFGGGAVLFAQNPEGISEVVNDLDGDLSTFFQVLQCPQRFEQLQRWLALTPCSQVEFTRAAESSDDAIERAGRFFVRNRQSRQGLGRDFATLVRNRTRRGMNELCSAWLSALDGLPEVHDRLRRVVVLNDDALKVIRQQDGPRSLFYCDPPYLHHTRNSVGEYGHFEMSEGQHRELLKTLSEIRGRFLLSGYHSRMYDNWAALNGFKCHEMEIDNKASSAKVKARRTECVWTNF